MRAVHVFVIGILFGTTGTFAGADKRLATAKTAYVEAVDQLNDDRVVAACFATHLPVTLPLTVVTTRKEADLILKVKADIAGGSARAFGALGSVEVIALAQDGTKVWSGFRSMSQERGALMPAVADVACQLADTGIELLRKEMKKARGK